jgi:hypothetical protein
MGLWESHVAERVCGGNLVALPPNYPHSSPYPGNSQRALKIPGHPSYIPNESMLIGKDGKLYGVNQFN